VGLCPTPHQRNFLQKVSLESSKNFKQGDRFRFLFSFQSLTVSSFDGLYGTLRVEVEGLAKSEVRLRRLDYSLPQSRAQTLAIAAFSLRDTKK